MKYPMNQVKQLVMPSEPLYQCTTHLTARCSRLAVDPNQKQGFHKPYSHPKEQRRSLGTLGIARGCFSVNGLG